MLPVSTGSESTRGGMMNLTVKNIERTWLDVPFREIPAKNMVRELPHWTLFELCRVDLECGVGGYGETMCYYTWGTVSDDDVARATGRNASEIMWDDSLGAGLQMALFDAVGKATDTPCWALLGQRVRDRVPVSFWDIDMSGEDWLSECKTAVEAGYTNFKSKARPWFDLNDQLDVLTRGTPDWLELDMDFNGLLVDTARATRVIRSIEKYNQVAILETPIPQGDVAGMKRIRAATHLPIAMHYGNPSLQTAVSHDLCDGFVVGGGADAVTRHGAAIAEAEKIFWLQLVGTGLTAAWSVQLAAVLTHARWPAVNCHQLYVDQIARPVMKVQDGYAAVPETPGLGVEPDHESVEKYRTEPKEKPYPAPGLVVAVRWPSGGSSYYGHTMAYWKDFQDGKLPLFVPGV
jgi:L-alanine-DL-glutamate epimerase-like enolase superfamily enzyme